MFISAHIHIVKSTVAVEMEVEVWAVVDRENEERPIEGGRGTDSGEGSEDGDFKRWSTAERQ